MEYPQVHIVCKNIPDSGIWYGLPIDVYDVALAHDLAYIPKEEDLAITEWTLPLAFDSSVTFEELNRLFNAVCDIQAANPSVADHISEVAAHFGLGGIYGVCESLDFLRVHHHSNMRDFAVDYVAMGRLGEIPEKAQAYIDYESLWQDLENEGSYLQLPGYIVEYTG